MTLSNSGNTYSGGTVLNAGGVAASFGTLTIGSSSNFNLGTGPLGIGPLTFTGGTLRATSPLTLQNQLSFSNGTTTGNSYVAFSGSPMTFSNSGNNTITGTANLIVNTNTTINERLGDGQSPGSLDLFSGSSTLFLQAMDTYSATTTVNSGNLVLDANGSLNTSGVFVDVGGTFTEDNTTASGGNPLPLSRLLALSFGMNLNGGTFDLKGGTGGSTENFGFSGLVVQSGNSTIITDSSQAGSPATITTGILYRYSGATVNFQTVGTQILGGASNQIGIGSFGSSPVPAGVVNGVLPYAVVTDHTTFNSGFNLATVSAAGQVQALPQASYTPVGSLTYTSTDSTANLLLNSSLALAASDTVNAMLLVGNGINVSGAAGFTLGVGSGQIVSTGGTNTVSVPNLAFGSAEGILYTNTGSNTVSSNITGTGGLTISGPGNLVLPTPNLNYNNSNLLLTGAAQTNSVQTITFNPLLVAGVTSTTGTFSLSFNGVATGSISFNPTASVMAANIQTALQALTTIGPGNALVTFSSTASPPDATPFSVTFTGGLAGQVLPSILVNATAIGGTPQGGTTGSTMTPGTGPYLTITTVQMGQNATTLDGGTLTLGTNNAISEGLTITSGTIAASSAVVLADGVSIGTTFPGASASNPYIVAGGAVTFGGSNSIVLSGGLVLNGESDTVNVTNTLPTIISSVIASNPGDGGTNGSNFVGTAGYLLPTALVKQGPGTLTLTQSNVYWGATLIQQGIVNIQSSNALGATGNEIQTITVTGNPENTSNATGFFTLTFEGVTSVPILIGNVVSDNGNYSLVVDLQGALDGMSNIGLNNTIVSATTNNSGTTTGTSGGTNGITYTVIFQNALAAQNLPVMTAAYLGTLTSSSGTPTVSVTIATTGNSAVGTVVSSGATLQIQGGTGGLGNVYNRLTLNGNGVGGVGALQNLNGPNIETGAITLASAASIGGPAGQLQFNGSIAGGGDFIDVGSAKLVLQGSNIYSGETIINGIIEVQIQTDALGASVSGTVVNNGGTLILGGGYEGVGESLTLNGNGLGFVNAGGVNTPLGALVGSNDSNVQGGTSNTGNNWFGDITLGSNVTINAEPTSGTEDGGSLNTPGFELATGGPFGLQLYGNISDNGNHFAITKVGGGQLTYWSPVTYSGPTTVTAGPLVLAGEGTLTQSTVTVAVNAELCLDDTAADVSNRYPGNVNLYGGTFLYLANNNPGVIATDTLGTINLLGGNNTVESVAGTGLGDATIITSAGLSRARVPRSTSCRQRPLPRAPIRRLVLPRAKSFSRALRLRRPAAAPTRP